MIDRLIEVSKQGTCNRLQVGALVTLGNDIVAVGYNTSPPNTKTCLEVSCEVVGGHCVRTIHAEVMAISKFLELVHLYNETAYTRVPNSLKSLATLYVTHEPCYQCAKFIAMAGIKQIKYLYPYRSDQRVADIYEANDIVCEQLSLYELLPAPEELANEVDVELLEKQVYG